MAKSILITGAAGNLGGHLTRFLLGSGHALRLLVHRKSVPDAVARRPEVRVFRGDLARPETLREPCREADAIVHFAGVLFRPRPEAFLPVTNAQFFRNLADVALEEGAKRILLVSFPHVEGPTTPEAPARGRLDADPVSVHARTRLEEERYLFDRCRGASAEPVSLRAGMVYGRDVLMIDAARRLLRWRLLAVWPEPTGIHLISLDDFLAATAAAAVKRKVEGIYHLGDEKPVTLQEFLDAAARHWGFPRCRRLPAPLIRTAAWCLEMGALLFGTRALLTRDFIRIGMVPYCGDTARMRRDLLPVLKYPTLEEGLAAL